MLTFLSDSSVTQMQQAKVKYIDLTKNWYRLVCIDFKILVGMVMGGGVIAPLSPYSPLLIDILNRIQFPPD